MNIISMIVDRCSVGDSNLKVIRYVVSRLKKGYKTFKALPRDQRRDIMRTAIKTHEENRRLYMEVTREGEKNDNPNCIF